MFRNYLSQRRKNILEIMILRHRHPIKNGTGTLYQYASISFENDSTCEHQNLKKDTVYVIYTFLERMVKGGVPMPEEHEDRIGDQVHRVQQP